MAPDVQREKEEILAILEKKPEGLSRGEISELICFSGNYKKLQRRLEACQRTASY